MKHRSFNRSRMHRLHALVRHNPKLRSKLRRVVQIRRSVPASTAPRYPFASWLGQTRNTDAAFRPGQPKYIVMHYTAAGSGLVSAKYLLGPHTPSSSAHFVVDRDGKTYQISGIDLKTWHAGVSKWKGIEGLNSYAIGIEYANYGFWRKDIAAAVPNPDQSKWIAARHKNGGPVLKWEPYPAAQIEAGKKLTAWLLKQIPGIIEIVGHDDISPGRKSDPGPAFPMQTFQDLLHEIKAAPSVARTPTPGTPVGLGLMSSNGANIMDPVSEPLKGFSPELTISDLEDDGRDETDIQPDEAELIKDVSGQLHAMAVSLGETPQPKPATQSLGIMGPAIGILFSVLGGFGLVYSESDVESFSRILPQLAVVIPAVVGGALGIFARYRADGPIKGGPADPAVIERKEARAEKRKEIKKL